MDGLDDVGTRHMTAGEKKKEQRENDAKAAADELDQWL